MEIHSLLKLLKDLGLGPALTETSQAFWQEISTWLTDKSPERLMASLLPRP